jgi:hypothetical protein
MAFLYLAQGNRQNEVGNDDAVTKHSHCHRSVLRSGCSYRIPEPKDNHPAPKDNIAGAILDR